MKKFLKILIPALVVAAGAMFGYAQSANATVTVTPMIVLIQDRERYADVNLINSAIEANNYSVEWLYFKQTEGDGLYEVSDKSITDFDLAKHIVYTPKRFNLKARGVQKVRLAVRLNGEPPAPGDYRAHLLLKKSKDSTAQEKLEPGQAKVAVDIGVGFSIPVVYRVGVSDAVPVIGEITTQVNNTTGAIEVVVPVERQGGPYGILGHLIVYNNGEIVGEIQNANIFSDIRNRKFVVSLLTKEIKPGNLRIVYKDFDKMKNTIFAEKTISISK